MRQISVAFWLVIILAFGAPLQADAQALGSLIPGGAADAQATSDEALAETLRKAADNGVSIVVIDTEGNVLSGTTLNAASDEVAASPELEHSALMQAQERALRFRGALTERLMLLPAAFNEVGYILRAASPDGTIFAFVKALGISLLLFGVGAVVESEIFGKRIVRRYVVARVQKDPQGYGEKMPFLVFRFGMGVVGILVSMTVAYILGVTLFDKLEDTAMQFTVTLINLGYFSCRLVAGLWRMILSPFLPQYRIPMLSDRDAKRLHRWLWMLASLDIIAILFGQWIGELGLNYDVYAFLASMMSAVVVLLNILLVVVNHKVITNALRHGKPPVETSLMTRVLCRIWAPVVILYVLFAWVELTYDLVLANPNSIPLIAGAYGILISIIVVYGVINFAIERWFARARALRARKHALAHKEEMAREQAAADELAAQFARMDAEDGPETADSAEAFDVAAHKAKTDAESVGLAASEPQAEAAIDQDTLSEQAADIAPVAALPRILNSFEALARRIAGILAFVAGVYAFFYIWDNDSARMVESYADRLLDIMVILFIGYIVYHAFRIWIDTKIEEETEDEVEGELGDEGAGTSASRLATLLPLFRNFILIVIVVSIALIILMEIGINVGPLFAGAGIVGVAVGFGSQALVRDIFAGAFFLFDDAFRKGEYLDVGGIKGTVEKISVRSFQLRHHLGALHTMPFGEIQVMTNYSRDWVIMKLPLRVTYDTDVEAVRKMIKKLGQELLSDPVIGENFIQPLKSQGVIEMQDSAMIIRVKFMTKPGDQWLVRKKVYEEIRALFERNGVRFAHREVTVRLADGKVDDLTEEQKREIAAAAHSSIEEDMEEGGTSEADDR